MHFQPPIGQIGAEIIFRSTIIAFSKAFWDVELLNENALPPGPCFIYGNHSNNYDPFILNAFSELGGSTAGVMTMEYLQKGPLASLFRASGIVGTQKRVPEPHLIRQIWKMAEEGRRIVIFPEGGRRWDGRPAPWIESTAKLFMKLGIPVYPIRIHGSYAGWPRWATFPRPAHIKLEVCPPLDFSDRPSLAQGLKRLKKPISQDENQVPEHIKPGWAFRPIAGITKLLYRDPWTGEFNGFIESGSTILRQSSSERSWSMLPDSTLKDQTTGEILFTGDLYNEIRNLPLDRTSEAPILKNESRVTIINSDGLTTSYFEGEVSLWSNRISFSEGQPLSLDKIRYTGLEKSNKIWILTSEFSYHLVFTGHGSVLAWQDVLNKLLPDLNC
jgi:1-acyl-sn-glycerol-3-phosphate acyltransferase